MEEPLNKETPKTKEETLEKEGISMLKTVRTYKTDVASILKNKKTSLTKMVLAEKEKKGSVSPVKQSFEKTNFRRLGVIVAIAAVIGSGFFGFYLYNKQGTKLVEITELKTPAYVFPNYQREVFVKLNKDSIIESIKKEESGISIPLGSVMQLFLTTEDKTKKFKVQDTEGYKLLVTNEVFFDTLGMSVPPKLTRALETDFMFGYHSSLGNNPFLLFKVKSFENAFAGMLDWEKAMLDNLSVIFETPESKNNIEDKSFKDIIIVNKDVRAILDKKGKIYFAYSFPDQENLVIVNNETTLQEIYRRINTANLERTTE